LFARNPLNLTEEYVIVTQNNGYGDQISATTMIRCIQNEAEKQGNPGIKIVLRPSLHETWENNPRIMLSKHDENFEYNFFEKWKKDLQYPVIDPPVYAYIETMDFNDNDYVQPFAKILCDLAGVPFDKDEPELYFTELETLAARNIANSFSKPIVLIHTAGSNLEQNNDLGNPNVFNLNKDWVYEHWVNLVNLLYNDFDVVQVGLPNERLINGAFDLRGKISFRQILALVMYCQTWVDIDSFLQHAGAAVKKPGVVLWGRTDPRIFGHALNANMQAVGSCPDLPCMRPRAAGGDMVVKNGEIVPWSCSHMNCMKQLSAEKVAGQVFALATKVGGA